jgi:pimeloyl-ACP methyl ester carboxylesterase
MRPAGHLRAAITYYRDAPTRAPKTRTTSADPGALIGWDVPLLYLHGMRDGCIGVTLVEQLRSRLRSNIRVEVVEDQGHFLQLEKPAVINELILGFLAEHASS